MKDSGLKNYMVECHYQIQDYDGIERRGFILGDFLSDIEINIGDHLAFSGGSYPDGVPGFYIGKVVDMITLSGNCGIQKDSYILSASTNWKIPVVNARKTKNVR